MIFDPNKPLFMSARSTEGAGANTCVKLWKDANDIVEEVGVQPIQSIDETTPVSSIMVEVEDLKKSIQVNIHNLIQFE